MIRLIIEGESGKSEYVFWYTLLKSLTSNLFEIYSTFGNKGAENVVRHICTIAKKDDIVILGLDKYTWSTYKTCVNLLQRESNIVGFTLMKLGAGSFEGMILSYTELSNMIRIKISQLSPILNEVADLLNNKRSIRNKLGEYETTLKSVGITPDTNTQERFISWLLAQVTRHPRAMRVDKGEIGQCWLSSCCDASFKIKVACVNQGERYIPYLVKMFDLESKSLMNSNTHNLTFLQGK